MRFEQVHRSCVFAWRASDDKNEKTVEKTRGGGWRIHPISFAFSGMQLEFKLDSPAWLRPHSHHLISYYTHTHTHKHMQSQAGFALIIPSIRSLTPWNKWFPVRTCPADAWPLFLIHVCIREGMLKKFKNSLLCSSSSPAIMVFENGIVWGEKLLWVSGT